MKADVDSYDSFLAVGGIRFLERVPRDARFVTLNLAENRQTSIVRRLGEVAEAVESNGFRSFIRWRTYGRNIDEENNRISEQRIRSDFSARAPGFEEPRITEIQGVPVSVAEVVLPFTDVHVSQLLDPARCVLVAHNQPGLTPDEFLHIFTPYVSDLHECAFEIALERRPACFLIRLIDGDDGPPVAQVVAHRWLAEKLFQV